ncbi:MAG: ABC transporter permease [Burkholderiaceae bacterium]|nr:ABC transporter permease [Microbacteriaceae bacterium]
MSRAVVTVRWPGAVVATSAALLLFLLTAAVLPGLLAPGNPLAIAPLEAFQPPSAAHLLGTDESGRDLYTRIIHGAGPSLLIGAFATVIGLGLGGVLGAIAGLGPHWVDAGTTRFVEVLFAFPGLLLALLFIVIAGPGPLTSTVAVGLATAPGYARLVRTQVLAVRRSAYVESAIVLGRGWWRRLVRHIAPNVGGTLFVLVTLGIGQSIVWASALSYLGLGVSPPAAEWGAMLSAGRTYVGSFWWLTFFPGLAIVLSAASTTLLGRHLQQRTRSS